MFPLGSVLFPHMPLMLRVFEPRYVEMLSFVLQEEPAEFGVVLIERGQEVGGGEKRFSIGTVARITELEAADGFFALVARGGRRIEIAEWIDENPFPQADVRELPALAWDDSLEAQRDAAELLVRQSLEAASVHDEQLWSASVELSDDLVEGCWQLAAIAPLGPLDQLALLRSETLEQLLTQLIELTEAAGQSLGAVWSDDT